MSNDPSAPNCRSPIEWLANSLYEARACDVFEFVASLRQQRDEQTAAQEAAAAEADAAA